MIFDEERDVEMGEIKVSFSIRQLQISNILTGY